MATANIPGSSRNLILGLNYSGVHDSAVVLIEPTGKPLYACALERLTRAKQDGRWPDSLLAEVPWDRVAAVAVSTFERPLAGVAGPSKVHPLPFVEARTDSLEHGEPFLDRLAKLPVPPRFVCHHLSHAASAFWPSGFEEALCLVYDGGIYNSPWFGGLFRANRSGGIEPLDMFAASHHAKITSLYSIVTALLGFTPNKHEGKVTGLAAFGKPNSQIRTILSGLMAVGYREMESIAEWSHQYEEDRPASMAVNPVLRGELFAKFGNHSRADIAATLQAMAEEHVIQILGNARRAGWTSDSICLSGGLFANVKINQRVKEFGFRHIFISPPMTDDGTALGAALVVASENHGFAPPKARDMFLGASFGHLEIEGSLKKAGVIYRKVENPVEYLVERLCEGAVAGIVQGRMEFGPRALCNRSIVSQATDASINARLNGMLRRTEFMPFAPITRVEDAAKCYIGLEGAEHAAEFMTITCNCTDAMKRQSPAVVHVDGTARPQLVREDVHPLMHRILSAYRERMGNCSLINTSFNVHEEPIVCSPEDALRGFLESGIDLVYFEGGYVAEIRDNAETALRRLREVVAAPSQKENRLADEVQHWAERTKQEAHVSQERMREIDALKAECNKRDREIVDLKAECNERDRELLEKGREIDALKRTCDERLELINRLDAAVRTLESSRLKNKIARLAGK